jgi:uncharacterized membrane protein YdjX (TVP38/TMEM64 family)
MESNVKKKSFNASMWFGLIGVTVLVCVLLVIFWKHLEHFQILIFSGLFFTAILAGSPIPVPTPCMALTFTLGSRFEPIIIGLIASSGAAIGSMLVYYSARTGRHFFPILNISDPASKIYSNWFGKFLQKIKIPIVVEFINRKGIAGVFFCSIFPNPLLMPILVVMGINRVRVWKVSLSCLLGHSVLFIGLAFLGHYGLGSLLRYFGVFTLPG